MRWRVWVLLIASLVAIYWLQPSTPIRRLDFWLPTASVLLTIFVWVVTRSRQINPWRSTLAGVLCTLGVILLIGLTRYIDVLCCLTPTPPPELWRILIGLGIALAASSVVYLSPARRWLPTFTIVLILGLFLVLKTTPLAQAASAGLRSLTGQQVELASALDLPWLGFSYLAFRLLHVLRDYQGGKLPEYTLGEFVTYAIFFPTYTAGPIDRLQRFMGDLRLVAAPTGPVERRQQKTTHLIQGSQRIFIGVFKKFVLADSLALIALNEQNAAQTSSTLWMWVLLYAFALRIYFDFSGYTDIALGLGRLMDFNLPENFNRPYLKQNLTAFWNSWHITLAQWFRAYFFNPLTRLLRASTVRLPIWSVILIGQLSTMALIGLWHGVTWNFLIWGVWHGLGLFIHNRWSDWMRPRLVPPAEPRPLLKGALQFGGWLLTFNFVALSWVWFALPSVSLSVSVFQKLAGF
jgi:D-alanyl-lipoteichoic acid acyltransferase DltB (MBOAT superfamily)